MVRKVGNFIKRMNERGFSCEKFSIICEFFSEKFKRVIFLEIKKNVKFFISFFYLFVQHSIFADLVTLSRTSSSAFHIVEHEIFLTFFSTFTFFWIMWVTFVSRVSHIVCIFFITKKKRNDKIENQKKNSPKPIVNMCENRTYW